MGVSYDLCVSSIAWTDRFERNLKPKRRAANGSALPVENSSTDGGEGESGRVERISTRGASECLQNHVQPNLPSEYSKELSKEESKHSVRMRTARRGRQVEKTEEAFEERPRKALKLLQAAPDLRLSELKTQAHLTDQEARDLHAKWRQGVAT